jgi:hypothetical protein
MWTRLRRLVASIMLVAVASFVLHGGGMAGLHQHGRGSTECATPALGGHGNQAAVHGHGTPDVQHETHDHGVGVAHHHADADLAKADLAAGDVSNDRHAASEGSACCASVCAVALIAFGSDTMSVPMGSTLAVVFKSQIGSGINPNGLKRPPRTPSIA